MRILAVYPYTLGVSYIKENCRLLKDYEKVILITPAQVSLQNEESDEYIITNDWHQGIVDSDAVLLLPGINKMKRYQDIVLLASQFNKKIYCSRLLNLENTSQVSVISQNECDIEEPLFLHKITTPVITITSLGENSEKFALQLMVGKYFKEQGYKVLQIGSNELSSFFGITQLPKCMFQELPFSRKIHLLNQYIYEKTETDHPDLIIIGCPGGIMPYNRYVHNYYAELPLVIARALEIDINVSILYMTEVESVGKKYIGALDSYERENLGCDTNIFTMSNIYANFNRERGKQEYMYFEDQVVHQKIQSFNNNKLFDKNDEETVKQVFSGMEKILKTEFEVI